MTPFRQISIKSHIGHKIWCVYIFIYKLHDQTRDRARDQTSWSDEFVIKLPLLLLHRIAVFQEISFVSRQVEITCVEGS